jgi:uncharacterized membrane protein
MPKRKPPRATTPVPGRAPGRSSQPPAPVPEAGPPAPDRAIWTVWALAFAYTVVYSVLSAIRYRYYLYTDFDLAIFTQATDGIIHGRLHSSIRGMYWLGDHSSLILFLVAPLYAIARHPVTLLVVQSAALGAGAFPVHALARRELGNRGLALACVTLYLLYPALGYANLFEFHPEMLATPALLASFTFLRAGRLRPTLLWTGVALLCREDVMLVVFAMALYALTLRRPGRLRVALSLAAAAGVSAAITWGVLRPVFTHGEADYARVYSRWGTTLPQALLAMLQDPLRTLHSLVATPNDARDSLIKFQYHVALFTPLALLPLLSPLTLAIALPAMAEHLLSWRTSQHTILCQYTALVTPFVAAAAVIGLRNLRAWLPGERWTTALMAIPLGAAVGGQLFFGPLLSDGRFFATPTLGRHWPTGEERAMARLRDGMLRRLPPHGGVVASFELLDHLTARDSVHSLHHVTLGTYTFSHQPYPIPTGVSAMIADLASTNVLGSVDENTYRRLGELARINRLIPVAMAGDLILWLADAPDTLALSGQPCSALDGGPIGFDGEIAYLGCTLTDSIARPGGLVALRTCWRRIGTVDRRFTTRLRLWDAQGHTVLDHARDLGYLMFPPHAWGEGAAISEVYRLVLPDDLHPGNYRLTLSVEWRGRGVSGASQAHDPSRYSGDAGIELGRVRVEDRGRRPTS